MSEPAQPRDEAVTVRPDQPNQKERLAGDLKRGMAVTSLLIVLFTTGLQAALLKALHLDDALTLLGTFAKTAPLTTALVAAFYVAMWWEFRTNDNHFFGKWVAVTTVFLWAAAAIGNWAGAIQIKMPPHPGPVTNPFIWVYQFLARAIQGFYGAYGPAGFWSSLVLAGFLVFAIYRIGLYYEEIA
ncbi:MAG: hypothetical protein HONBIEJF_01507 [Fimbriimonadaceae bacterium]|nr:hypothetical protein [Fimbriimonadaceae bacterium]